MKLRAGHLTVLGLALVTASHVSAQWVQFAETDTSTSSFDRSTITPDLAREIAYFAWWRSTLSTPARLEGSTVGSHLTEYRVDCQRRTLQQRQRIYFSPQGQQVRSEGATMELLPTANTLGDSFVKTICAQAGR